MKANYHTHTSRCGHAEGTDEQYVKAAVSQGFDVLGFADHVPWPYKSGFVHHGVRMPVTQLDEYVQAMRDLRDKYADQISLRIGFECEYFPEYMDWLHLENMWGTVSPGSFLPIVNIIREERQKMLLRRCN